jgi:glycosyltransferase involved in cell wall biosynthesis
MTDLNNKQSDRRILGINVYQIMPEDTTNLFESDRLIDPQCIWPWNFPKLSVPELMPSGRTWPKISIVTVTYNQADYLEETIRSVLCQNYPNLEYIVIDGGSTDHTLSVIKRYEHELSYWISEPDRGQANALNKGFAQSTGEILAWLNSDDRYLSRTLYHVALAYDAYNSDMVVGGCLIVRGRNPEPVAYHHTRLPYAELVDLPLNKLLDLDKHWQGGFFFYQPEVFWSRSIWERSGAHVNEDLYYSMDYELWVRMAVAGANVFHIPEPLTLFRVHESQKTFGDDLPFLKELRELNKQLKKELKA